MRDQEVRDWGHLATGGLDLSWGAGGLNRIAGWGEEFRGAEDRVSIGGGESKGELGVRQDAKGEAESTVRAVQSRGRKWEREGKWRVRGTDFLQ